VAPLIDAATRVARAANHSVDAPTTPLGAPCRSAMVKITLVGSPAEPSTRSSREASRVGPLPRATPLARQRHSGHKQGADCSQDRHCGRDWTRRIGRWESREDRQLPDGRDLAPTRRRCARNATDPGRVASRLEVRHAKLELAIPSGIDHQLADGMSRADRTLSRFEPHLQARAGRDRRRSPSHRARDDRFPRVRLRGFERQPQCGPGRRNRSEQGPDDDHRSGDQPPPPDAHYVVVRSTTPCRATSIFSPVHARWLAYAKLVIGLSPIIGRAFAIGPSSSTDRRDAAPVGHRRSIGAE